VSALFICVCKANFTKNSGGNITKNKVFTLFGGEKWGKITATRSFQNTHPGAARTRISAKNVLRHLPKHNRQQKPDDSPCKIQGSAGR
jgi:hypothetical protein